MSINLEDLGLSEDDLRDRVVNKIARQLLSETRSGYDEDGDLAESDHPTQFDRELRERAKVRIDATIEQIGREHVYPRVEELIQNLCLQETNRWGEKRGQAKTFVEYLTERAESYLKEEVDYHGRSSEDCRRSGYSWSGGAKKTRVTHLIDQYLHCSIEQAMTAALKGVMDHITGGLAETAKMKLGEIAEKLKVQVTTK